MNKHVNIDTEHAGSTFRHDGETKSNTIDQELLTFANQLRDLGDIELMDAVEMLGDLKVPDGYQHLRLTIFETIGRDIDGKPVLGDGVDGGAMFDTWEQQLDLSEIVLLCQSAASMQTYHTGCETVWVETIALQTKDPGFLELGLVFEQRP